MLIWLVFAAEFVLVGVLGEVPVGLVDHLREVPIRRASAKSETPGRDRERRIGVPEVVGAPVLEAGGASDNDVAVGGVQGLLSSPATRITETPVERMSRVVAVLPVSVAGRARKRPAALPSGA